MQNGNRVRNKVSLAVLAALACMGAAWAADVARVRGKDGKWTEVPIAGVREADGGVRYTFPAADGSSYFAGAEGLLKPLWFMNSQMRSR